ncbi:hypothetical protein CRYUN_Cryun23aG0093200 [Craigia yunnanensis]
MADDALLKQLEESTKDVARHQAETLHFILQHQRGVRYLQRHLHDVEDHNAPIEAAIFRRSVPLSCYDDYADYINQLANGDDCSDDRGPHHLLSVDPLVCFFYSSVTTSMKPKLIPYFDSALSKAASYIAHQGSAVVLLSFFPPRPEVNRRLAFIYADSVTTTKGGFKVMVASSFPLHSSSNAKSSLFVSLTSPMEVILGSNVEHQTYCHILCGLKNSDSIDAIHAPYAIGLIKAFRVLESKWEQLCEVPLLGGDYFASECCVAINMDIKQPPDLTRFVMLPTAAYFKFLPFDSTENIVVGDIVRVVDFYNSSPLLEFVMRAPKTSYEIVTEVDLIAAMESFQLVLRNIMGMEIEIVEFTNFFDFGLPKRLKIFIEVKDCDMILQDKLRESIVLVRKCCSALEDSLGSIYKVQRDKGEIHPLSLSILKCGSFDRLLEVAIENGAPASQYKPPKMIRNRDIVDVMEGCSCDYKLRISMCLMACSPLILKGITRRPVFNRVIYML